MTWIKPVLYKGNNLYPNILKKVQRNETALIAANYQEASKKQGLFYFHSKEDNCTFFADMRGTKITPIWENTSPYFFWKFEVELSKWKQRRIITYERGRLSEGFGIFTISSASYETDELGEFEEEEGNGLCLFCEKDFQDAGLYCSEKCRLQAEEIKKETYQSHCVVCKRDISCNLFNSNKCSLIVHHISYNPRRVIDVCYSCHQKIHKTEKYPALKPSVEQMKARHKDYHRKEIEWAEAEVKKVKK